MAIRDDLNTNLRKAILKSLTRSSKSNYQRFYIIVSRKIYV